MLYAFLQRATCTSQQSSRTTPPSKRMRSFCPASWARPLPRSNGSKTVTKSFPPRTFSSNQMGRSACWSSRRRQRATWERTPATVALTKPQLTWTSKVIPAAIWAPPPRRPRSGLQNQALPTGVHRNPAAAHLQSILHYCLISSCIFVMLRTLEDNPTLYIWSAHYNHI